MQQKHITAVAAGILLCGCGPVDERQALSAATETFRQTCSNLHYQASEFTGPFKTSVGKARFAFEWRTKNLAGLDKSSFKTYGILVSVTASGDTEAALLDRPPAN